MAISISSLEHDGLGRYGDAVDPDADLAAIFLLSQVPCLPLPHPLLLSECICEEARE